MRERYHLADLMLDACEFAEGASVESVTHIVRTSRGYIVVQNGRVADGLAFDEMLGQVVDLLHPKLGQPHYRMMTRDEIAAENTRRSNRSSENLHHQNFAGSAA